MQCDTEAPAVMCRARALLPHPSSAIHARGGGMLVLNALARPCTPLCMATLAALRCAARSATVRGAGCPIHEGAEPATLRGSWARKPAREQPRFEASARSAATARWVWRRPSHLACAIVIVRAARCRTRTRSRADLRALNHAAALRCRARQHTRGP